MCSPNLPPGRKQQVRGMATQKLTNHLASLLAEVSYSKRRWRRKRETSAGLQCVLSSSCWTLLWPNLTYFQNRFRLMWNARVLFRLHAGNFWAHSCYRTNQFCKLSHMTKMSWVVMCCSSLRMWRQFGHIGGPKKWNANHANVPKNSCVGMNTFPLLPHEWKWFITF